MNGCNVVDQPGVEADRRQISPYTAGHGQLWRSRHCLTITKSINMDCPMWIGTMCEVLFAASVRQLAQPSLEEPPLQLLLGETEGQLVGVSGFRCSPKSPAEIRSGRVCKVIVR